MQSRSDDELMSLVREGNEPAFAALYHRHKADVYGFCMRLFAGDRSRVDDACQETWTKVVRKAEQYQLGTNFKGWLMTIARNEALSDFRKTRPDFSLSDEKSPEVPDSFDVHEALSSAHAVEEIRAAIDSLPDLQRVVLLMWIEEDLSYQQMCQKLDMDFNSLRAHLYRARLSLKARLEKA